MSNRFKKNLTVLVVLVILYALMGFWVLPWVVTTQLPPKLAEQLGRPVSIQAVRFNPFLFKLHMEKFGILEQDGTPLLGFDELFIDFEPLASLFKQSYIFSDLRLGLPYGLVVIHPDGRLNLADLQLSPKPQTEHTENGALENSKEDSTKLPPLRIEKISVQQGIVEFRDQSRPTPFVAHMVPINLTLENFSTQQGRENPYSLSAELSEGEKIFWEGSLVLDPFQSRGSLALENIQLPGLWAYVQDQFRFEIPRGLATLTGRYEVITTTNQLDVRVNSGNLTVKNGQIREKGEVSPIVELPLLEVKDVTVDVEEQDVNIPSIKAQDARFIGWIQKSGELNYQSLFVPIESRATTTTHAGFDSASSPQPDMDTSPTASKPWNVIIQDIALDDFTLDFEDRQPEEPVKLFLDALHFHTSDVFLDFRKPIPVDLSFQLNQTGKARFQGSVATDPLTVDLALSLSDIDLQPFQPYVAPFVQFDLDSGRLAIQGQAQFQKGSSRKPLFTFHGEVGVSSLILEDPTQASPFLKWDTLQLKKMDLQVEPTELSLEEVRLLNPAVVLVIDADGGLNLKRLFAPPALDTREEVSSEEPTSKTESSDETSTPVKIGNINITNLFARVADASITPHVVTQIEGLTGTIKGLSSDQLAKADVHLEGKIDRYAPFHIEGQINPLSDDAYTDLTLRFKNLDLTTVSPYAGKYAGYPITKGKLFLDLDYKISQKTLVGENKVLIDQLTMGSKIESPEATSLPIPLALALLKDRKGQIDIDLPVRGNLDDPDFSYGGVIWNALVNLLTKIVASPFAIVGGLLGGGGEDLQFVAFPAGQASVPSPEQEKLKDLAKALAERPGLRLEVAGAADPQIDRQALAWAQLRKQLQKKKFVKDPSAGQKGLTVEEIPLTPEEEARWLVEVYVEKFGPLPQETPSSRDETPPSPLRPEELKAKLIASMNIEEAELRLLAQQRAQNIRDYLIQDLQFPADRVFLVEPNLSSVTEEETVRNPLTLAAN